MRNMEMDDDVVGRLVSSLEPLIEKLESVVEQGKACFKASANVNDYIGLENKNGIRQVFSAMPVYADTMEKLGVRKRSELEKLWGKHYRHAAVRESVEMLLEAEENFTEFISEVDKELILYEDQHHTFNPLTEGELLPKSLALVEASSGERFTLETYWKQSRFTLFVLLRHFG